MRTHIGDSLPGLTSQAGNLLVLCLGQVSSLCLDFLFCENGNYNNTYPSNCYKN